jgi:hypothetical protein
MLKLFSHFTLNHKLHINHQSTCSSIYNYSYMFQLLIIVIFKDHHYKLKDIYSIGTYLCQLSIVKHTTVSKKSFVDWWTSIGSIPCTKYSITFRYNMHACKFNTESIAQYLFTSVTEYRVAVHRVQSLTMNWYVSSNKFTFADLVLVYIIHIKYKFILHSQTYHWTKLEGNLVSWCLDEKDFDDNTVL